MGTSNLKTKNYDNPSRKSMTERKSMKDINLKKPNPPCLVTKKRNLDVGSLANAKKSQNLSESTRICQKTVNLVHKTAWKVFI